MKLLITGATGFLGRRVVQLLLDGQAHQPVALVRSDSSAKALEQRGAETRFGDILDRRSLDSAVKGCDGVLHLAGDVRTGIPESQREQMFQVNVEGTRNVLGAALNAGVARVVAVATNNALGNTHGAAVDESYERPADEPFRSAYEESKYKAMLVGRRFVDEGLDVVTVLPGMVYGPEKTATVGRQIDKAATGRLRAVFLGGLGLDMAYIDDVAEGVIAAFDRGEMGEEYMLTGERSRLRDILAMAARIGGHSLPRLIVPDSVTAKLVAMGPLLRPLGMPANGREVYAAAAGGATYWGDHSKATKTLGYNPRGLEEGLRATIRA